MCRGGLLALCVLFMPWVKCDSVGQPKGQNSTCTWSTLAIAPTQSHPRNRTHAIAPTQSHPRNRTHATVWYSPWMGECGKSKQTNRTGILTGMIEPFCAAPRDRDKCRFLATVGSVWGAVLGVSNYKVTHYCYQISFPSNKVINTLLFSVITWKLLLAWYNVVTWVTLTST